MGRVYNNDNGFLLNEGSRGMPQHGMDETNKAWPAEDGLGKED